MMDRKTLLLRAQGFGARFWGDVEFAIETIDRDDLAEFERAGELPFEPRGSFEQELRKVLRGFVRARYGTPPEGSP